MPSGVVTTEAQLEEAKRDYRLIKRLLVAMLVASCAVPLTLNLVDPDLWGHVRYAQDAMREGRLPEHATHTFTAANHPWINHEILAEFALAFGYQGLGVYGLLAAKLALGMGVLWLAWRLAARKGVRPIACWTLLLLVATNLQPFWILRPQLLSFVACAAMLALLDRAFSGDTIRWRWLAGLPLLMALWVNSHGAFVAGLGIAVVYLVGKAIELLVASRAAWRPAAGLAALAALCVAATLVNPYGLEMWRWLADSLGTPRPEITEWRPPRWGGPTFGPFVTLVVVATAVLIASKARRDWTNLVVLALVGWQASEHLRHIAFFALLCAFWLPVHVQSVATRLRAKAAEGLPVVGLSRWAMAVAVVAMSGAFALKGVTVGDRLSLFTVSCAQYPVDALDYMHQERLRGKLVVCFNWAQYAIAALAPEVTVSFDGRFRTCYPQEVVDMNMDFLLGDETGPRWRSPDSGPIDPSRVLEYGEPDYVLVDRHYKTPSRLMAEESEKPDGQWSLVYQDGVAQLWGRKSVVDAPESTQFVPADRRIVHNEVSPLGATWPALPRRLTPSRDETIKTVAQRTADFENNTPESDR
ncbi:hypothetical protein Mal64_19790 [Pseudobythopirellula maris]|uniref:Glycosyltransferase RgtA/B/C/D-like domain-containing protein n=1 Tax=Pseudobythopirellula maris TaxID=2527991 RepID=A0A5C5ZN21_9BACT|nr:hypothetical protein [Pseudobythopirellula maris]TWT88496.1 hypothetical protein Mal64_19790 [Pseudobythopirellula maris]